MQHITNVLVHSNRCEVVDGHIFATGDKGLPHIHLKFLYMFGESSLQGKNLECKYLLPNGKYSAETVRISSKDEVTFPIHYSCFTVNGWTTLRITLVSGSNRVTLEDITIKTKETKLGDKYSNIEIENAITSVISVTTDSIRKEGEHVKQEVKKEIDNYIKENKNKLKGDQGPRGLQGLQGLTGKQGNTGETGPRGKSLNFKWQGDKLAVQVEGEEFQLSESLKGPKGATGERGERGPMGERGPQGMQGPRGMTGERGLTGQKGDRGTGITSISALDNNRVQMEYGDGQSIVVNIPTIEGKQGEKGKNGNSLEFNWNGTQLGVRQSGTSSYTYKDLQGPRGATGEKGIKGDRGLTGQAGNDGVGIQNIDIKEDTTNGSKHTYKIQFQLTSGDSIYKTFTVNDGEKGEKGDNGIQGIQGIGIKNVTHQLSGNNLTLDFELTDNTHKQVIVDLSNLSGASGKVVKDVELITTNNLFKFKITYSDETSTVLNLDKPIAKALQELMEELPFLRKDQSGTLNGNLTVQGSIYATDNVTAYSDIRLKKNIKPIDNALDKVLSLTGYTFDMNGKQMTGVIAQEIEEVLPEVVEEAENGYKTVAYGNIVGLLIQAIKELKKEVEVLKHDTK